MTGDLRILAHRLRGVARVHHKNIQRKRRVGRRMENSLRAAQIKSSQRLMNEHRPTRSADEPLNGHPATVRPQTIAALPAAHSIHIAPPVKLRTAFSQT